MFDTVVVLSGGMDSAVLLAHCLKEGQRCAAISFDTLSCLGIVFEDHWRSAFPESKSRS